MLLSKSRPPPNDGQHPGGRGKHTPRPVQGHEVRGTPPPTHPQFGGVLGILPFSWVKGSSGGPVPRDLQGAWRWELERWTPRSPGLQRPRPLLGHCSPSHRPSVPVRRSPLGLPPVISVGSREEWGGLGLCLPVQAGAVPQPALRGLGVGRGLEDRKGSPPAVRWGWQGSQPWRAGGPAEPWPGLTPPLLEFRQLRFLGASRDSPWG